MTNMNFDDLLMEVSALENEIIDCELLARSITPQRGPYINKRRQLTKALLEEHQGKVFEPFFQFEPLADLHRCAQLVTVFESHVTKNDSDEETKRKARINLKFLDARIGRVICSNNDERTTARNLSHNVKKLITPNVVDLNNSITDDSVGSVSGENNAQNESQDASQTDQRTDPQTNKTNVNDNPRANIHGFSSQQTFSRSTFNNPYNNHCTNAHGTDTDKSTHFQNPFFEIPFSGFTANQNANHNMFQSQSNTFPVYNPSEIERAMANLNLQSNQYPKQPNKLPIHKWNLKFHGLNDKQDAFEFLRVVKSKARSYNTSHDELFASASEFFIGEASKWYFSQQFDDWIDLEERLIADFMQVNYFDDLIDTIRQRKQSSNESVIQFITIFEDNCSRLRVPLPTKEKISILKRNVLQRYQSYIALTQFNSVNELKHALKLLEATMSYPNNSSNRYVHFDRHDNNRRNISFSPHRSNGYSHSPNRFDKFSHSPNRSENEFQKRTDFAQKSNHVSRFDETRNKNYSRSNSPYLNNNTQRERSSSNSNNNRMRSNSREHSFPQNRRDSSTHKSM